MNDHFSILKRVKKWQRSIIGQNKLTLLSLFVIKHELFQKINTETVANETCRKKCL